MEKMARKRVDIVKIKMCKEGSVMYSPRNITTPKDCVNLVENIIGDSDRENFVVIALNVKNEPQAVQICSVGSLSSAIVHPREIFKMAILANASSVILAHNHPSGEVGESKEDIAITQRLIKAGEILGIKVIDHIIVGKEGSYNSFKENKYIS